MTTAAATVVLVAHGSRIDEANAAHRTLVAALAQRTGSQVMPAFLELTEPDVPSAIDAAVASGAQRIVVLPYFLLPGAHTSRDIPAIIESARGRHPHVELTQAPHLGADPALLDALAAQVEQLDV